MIIKVNRYNTGLNEKKCRALNNEYSLILHIFLLTQKLLIIYIAVEIVWNWLFYCGLNKMSVEIEFDINNNVV